MTTTQTRNPLLALFASFIFPGLGQIYNGQFIKGLLLFLSLAVMAPLATWLALHSTKHLILLVLGLFTILALIIYIYSIVDAYRNAKRPGQDVHSTAINRPYLYVVLAIAGYALIVAGFQYIHHGLAQSFHMASTSMLPNVLPGDDIIIDKRDDCHGCKGQLLHGNLVVFVSPEDHHTLELKRIIGMPGDDLTIKGANISLNEVPMRNVDITEFGHAETNRLLQTYAAWREKCDKAVYPVVSPKTVTLHADIHFTVPDGQLYVLSDNRDDHDYSFGSNSIPESAVIGVAKQAWFSRDPQHAVRWWRVGHPVEANY